MKELKISDDTYEIFSCVKILAKREVFREIDDDEAIKIMAERYME